MQEWHASYGHEVCLLAISGLWIAGGETKIVPLEVNIRFFNPSGSNHRGYGEWYPRFIYRDDGNIRF